MKGVLILSERRPKPGNSEADGKVREEQNEMLDMLKKNCDDYCHNNFTVSDISSVYSVLHNNICVCNVKKPY